MLLLKVSSILLVVNCVRVSGRTLLPVEDVPMAIEENVTRRETGPDAERVLPVNGNYSYISPEGLEVVMVWTTDHQGRIRTSFRIGRPRVEETTIDDRDFPLGDKAGVHPRGRRWVPGERRQPSTTAELDVWSQDLHEETSQTEVQDKESGSPQTDILSTNESGTWSLAKDSEPLQDIDDGTIQARVLDKDGGRPQTDIPSSTDSGNWSLAKNSEPLQDRNEAWVQDKDGGNAPTDIPSTTRPGIWSLTRDKEILQDRDGETSQAKVQDKDEGSPPTDIPPATEPGIWSLSRDSGTLQDRNGGNPQDMNSERPQTDIPTSTEPGIWSLATDSRTLETMDDRTSQAGVQDKDGESPQITTMSVFDRFEENIWEHKARVMPRGRRST